MFNKSYQILRNSKYRNLHRRAAKPANRLNITEGKGTIISTLATLASVRSFSQKFDRNFCSPQFQFNIWIREKTLGFTTEVLTLNELGATIKT